MLLGLRESERRRESEREREREGERERERERDRERYKQIDGKNYLGKIQRRFEVGQ